MKECKALWSSKKQVTVFQKKYKWRFHLFFCAILYSKLLTAGWIAENKKGDEGRTYL